jgi:hypothetical protein
MTPTEVFAITAVLSVCCCLSALWLNNDAA